MTEHRLGDAPIDEKYREKMNHLAAAIDQFFNGDAVGDDRTAGFVLLVFPFGSAEGGCNFISNGADRKDIVILFREMIARFEGQAKMEGRA